MNGDFTFYIGSFFEGAGSAKHWLRELETAIFD